MTNFTTPFEKSPLTMLPLTCKQQDRHRKRRVGYNVTMNELANVSKPIVQIGGKRTP